MNWDAIGAVGEAAVVVTLAYLAVQIRRNTRQENFQGLQSAIQLYLNNLDEATRTKEGAEIFRKGLN